ncbi:MAG: FG-GAP repeat protein, partial [Kiritimatiellae bacterium]|nr:FG-GAP repeat protein [Kiritimatiellia bacterium]
MKRALAPFVVCLFTVLTAFGLNARFREKLTASDGTTNDAFGSAVDVDGDWAVMGAPKTSGDTNGVAYFFQWNGTNWVQQDRVTPSDSA